MQEKQDFLENHLLILVDETYAKLLKSENVDVLALYLFYYSTSKWQETSIVKATTGYAAKGLNISEKRVRAAKEYLKKANLIEDIKRLDPETGQVSAWFIKIKYVFGSEVHPCEFERVGEKSTLPLFHTVENRQTNALDIYKYKCLKDINVPFLDFAKYLKDSILKNNPEAKITDAQVNTWANDVRLMVERDGRDLEKMKVVLDWAQNNDFWKSNILSMGTFREKYDRLTIQSISKNKPTLVDRERGLHYEIKKRPVNVE